MPVQQPPDPLQCARNLWFGSYHGVLSTHALALPGYPFGSLLPICRDLHGLPLLLLSHLAQHTRNLAADPHCSLLLQQQGHGDVQQLARLICLAQVESTDLQTAARERYFRYYPDSRVYHENLNFDFFRLKPVRFYFVGGFGAARWFDVNRIIPDYGFSSDEEFRLLGELEAVMGQTQPSSNTTLCGVDCLGLDLRTGGELERIGLADPVSDQAQLLGKLADRLAQHPVITETRN